MIREHRRVTASAIVSLHEGDLAQLEALLADNHLPVDDCREQYSIFHAIYLDDELIAAGGVEPAGNFGLLRSIVVKPEHRGGGLARRLTDHLLERAQEEGREAIYLLTESAADYFAGLGFRPVERADVPVAITRTRQFSSLCPDSASCLFLPLPRV